jgi:cell division protein FtsB
VAKTTEVVDKERPGSTSGFAKQEEVTFLKWLMIGIIIVLALALGGFLTNTEAERKASYSDLQKQIQDQNTQIQILTKQ